MPAIAQRAVLLAMIAAGLLAAYLGGRANGAGEVLRALHPHVHAIDSGLAAGDEALAREAARRLWNALHARVPTACAPGLRDAAIAP